MRDQGSNTLSCTVWGAYATKLVNFLDQHETGPVVIILTLAKIKDTSEHDYDLPSLHEKFQNFFKSLTDEQRHIFDTIMEVVDVQHGGMSFLYGYGGTGGRTTHSKFSIPVPTLENSTCNIHQGSDLAQLLKVTKLIIWDEAPMTHKYCFEAFDKTLRDIISYSDNGNTPLGGKVIVFGGDFTQILLVIQGGIRSDIVNTTINASYL